MSGLTGFTFEANCARCGAEIRLDQTRVMSSRERRAFVTCVQCHTHFVVIVQMAALTADKTNGCGTYQGWKNHKLNGTTPCEPCRFAHDSMWQSRQRPSKPTTENKCGTNAGWMKHDHDGTPPCDDCKAARAALKRQDRAKKRQEKVG